MIFGHPVPHPRFLVQTFFSQFCDFPFFLFVFTPCRPKPKPKLTHFLSVWLTAFPLTGAAIWSAREQHLNTYVWGLGQDQCQCQLCLPSLPPGPDPGSQTRGTLQYICSVVVHSVLTCGCGWHFSVWLLMFAFCVFKPDTIVVFHSRCWYWL